MRLVKNTDSRPLRWLNFLYRYPTSARALNVLDIKKKEALQEETFDNSKSHLYPVSVFCPIDFADLGLYTR